MWEAECAIVAMSYVGAVQRAGGLALLLPPDALAAQDPAELLDHLDGLLLAGGADVGPATYGAEPHPETKGVRAERDAFELALLAGAIGRDLPVLGVCRGMQLLNVARGGTPAPAPARARRPRGSPAHPRRVRRP